MGFVLLCPTVFKVIILSFKPWFPRVQWPLILFFLLSTPMIFLFVINLGFLGIAKRLSKWSNLTVKRQCLLFLIYSSGTDFLETYGSFQVVVLTF